VNFLLGSQQQIHVQHAQQHLGYGCQDLGLEGGERRVSQIKQCRDQPSAFSIDPSADEIDERDNAHSHQELHDVDAQKPLAEHPENDPQEIGIERCLVEDLLSEPSFLIDGFGSIHVDR
jgi:hypothetical protein